MSDNTENRVKIFVIKRIYIPVTSISYISEDSEGYLAVHLHSGKTFFVTKHYGKVFYEFLEYFGIDIKESYCEQ